jgi:hypothetical protein
MARQISPVKIYPRTLAVVLTCWRAAAAPTERAVATADRESIAGHKLAGDAGVVVVMSVDGSRSWESEVEA